MLEKWKFNLLVSKNRKSALGLRATYAASSECFVSILPRLTRRSNWPTLRGGTKIVASRPDKVRSSADPASSSNRHSRFWRVLSWPNSQCLLRRGNRQPTTANYEHWLVPHGPQFTTLGVGRNSFVNSQFLNIAGGGHSFERGMLSSVSRRRTLPTTTTSAL